MNFARIMIRPRETMRRILGQPRDRMIIPLVLLAFFSTGIKDFRISGFREQEGLAHVGLVIVGAVVGVFAGMLLLFYIFGWIVYGIGKAFEGRGTVRAVRSALAWGFAPIVWALLYRVPFAFLLPPVAKDVANFRAGSRTVVFNPARFGDGCGVMLLVGLLDLTMVVWYIVVATRTLAEAHEYTGWRAFATLALAWVSPLVVAAAVVLSSVT